MSKEPSITLSPKHGLNPSLMLCFFCGEAFGVAIPGRLKGDAEAPREAVWNKEPCDKCAEWMKEGIILISVKDGECGDNPYRTGKWAVITEAAVKRLVSGPTRDASLRRRWLFVEDSVWEELGISKVTT